MKAQLNFEFKDFSSFLMGVFEEIFESNCFSDIELMGDDNIPLKAHKAILRSFSSTLREYMSSRQIFQIQRVQVSGVNYHDLKSLLQFVYLGEVNVARENLEKFFAIAKFLGIEQLQDQYTTNLSKVLGHNFNILTDTNLKTTENLYAEDSTVVNKECLSEIENEPKEENQIHVTEDYIVGQPSKIMKQKAEIPLLKAMKGDYEWIPQSPGKTVNIKAKVLFTQGYFERVIVRKGFRSYKGARCLNCSDGDHQSKLGIHKFIQGDHMTQDLRKHLRNKHEEAYTKFLLQESHFIDRQCIDANEVIDSQMQNEYLADIEDIEVGEVEPGYDLKEHVIFSHNFFRRIPVEKNGFPEDHAACLICVKLGGKTLLQIRNSNSGLKRHLANKHPEHFEKYENISKLFKEMKRNKM